MWAWARIVGGSIARAGTCWAVGAFEWLGAFVKVCYVHASIMMLAGLFVCHATAHAAASPLGAIARLCAPCGAATCKNISSCRCISGLSNSAVCMANVAIGTARSQCELHIYGLKTDAGKGSVSLRQTWLQEWALAMPSLTAWEFARVFGLIGHADCLPAYRNASPSPLSPASNVNKSVSQLLVTPRRAGLMPCTRL